MSTKSDCEHVNEEYTPTLVETCRAAAAKLVPLRMALKTEIDQRTPWLIESLTLDSIHSVLTQPATMERYSLPLASITKIDTLLHAPEITPEIRSTYLRLLLIALIESMPERIAAEPVPLSIEVLLCNNVLRIASELEHLPDEAFDLRQDFFVKDISILCLRLLPCGAEMAQVMAGIPRRLLFCGGVSQLVRGLTFFSRKTGGFKPFLSLHLDTRQLEEFTPEGWNRSYLRIADLLEVRPTLKGVFGTAWFYDPAMEEISPHLTYLRRTRVEAGAAGFRLGPTESTRQNALARSAKRRALFEAGEYMPVSYYIIWPRKALIAWARRHRLAAQPPSELLSK